MYLSPAFTTVKITPTLIKRQETQMEADEPDTQSQSPIERHQIPTPTTAKPKDYISPRMADKAGMRKWKDEMLQGHPGVSATSFEQWGNSYVTQFNAVVNTMIQSLRIKEEAYSNMFHEQAKTVSDSKKFLEESKRLLDEANAYSARHSDAFAKLISTKDGNLKLKAENKFLRET